MPRTLIPSPTTTRLGFMLKYVLKTFILFFLFVANLTLFFSWAGRLPFNGDSRHDARPPSWIAAAQANIQESPLPQTIQPEVVSHHEAMADAVRPCATSQAGCSEPAPWLPMPHTALHPDAHGTPPQWEMDALFTRIAQPNVKNLTIYTSSALAGRQQQMVLAQQVARTIYPHQQAITIRLNYASIAPDAVMIAWRENSK